MKTLKFITLISLLCFINIVVFYSCKKTATNENKEQVSLAEFYKQKLKDEPNSSTQVVNLPGKGYFTDLNGNRIMAVPGQANKVEASSCPDPGTSEFSQVLVSIAREYTCNVGYRFVIQYKLTTEFYPLLTNGAGQSSRGRIKLVNSSGAQVYITPTTTINPVITIQNNGVVGQNSNGNDLNEFVVTYRSEIIPEATYILSTGVQSNLTCYTDCANYPILSVGFSSQQQVIGSQQNSLPCLRIDKVYFNPRNGNMAPSLSGASGANSSCFPSGYVYPYNQQVEFKNAEGFWKSFWLYAPGAPPNTSGLINYWDVWYIDVAGSQLQNKLVPGNVQVRYRNNLKYTTTNGGPCVSQPDGTYVYETWYIN